MQQQSFSFSETAPSFERFPKTRYLGSKRKLLPMLRHIFSTLEFQTALDPFSGTGSVAYLLKTLGKSVTASDAQRFNAVASRALVENERVQISPLLPSLLSRIEDSDITDGFVETTFEGLFFLAGENRFIDRCLVEISKLDGYERDAALFVLGQACLVKRPYNLFHRANLNMRSREVKRSFGNKRTWDKPFAEHMAAFAAETDRAIFEGAPCRVCVGDVLDSLFEPFDLVYLDPPYISERGAAVDYADYYHFLDGLCDPSFWPDKILYRYKHRPLEGKGKSPFSDPKRIADAFEAVISRFSSSTLVVSYRSDGIPSVPDIQRFLEKAGKRVTVHDAGTYTYALSTNKRSREVVLVGV